MSGKTKNRRKPPKKSRIERAAEFAVVSKLADVVFGYMKDGMPLAWNIVKAYYPEWPQEKCELFLNKAKSLIIRNLRSGI